MQVADVVGCHGCTRTIRRRRPCSGPATTPTSVVLAEKGMPTGVAGFENRAREVGHRAPPRIAGVVLSDRTIARLLEEGRIEIDPYDEALLQPSSVDVRVDRLFRVFHNARYPFIDVKQPQEDLTELVEVEDGTPFILHPGEFVLGSTLERVRLPDDLVARLEGKALALDTEVPTTQGWTTMGELRPGELVFDEDGFPTVVLAATEPMLGRPCREVVFSDGTSIVCDVDHLWRAVDEVGRAGVVTTARIETACAKRTFSVPAAADPTLRELALVGSAAAEPSHRVPRPRVDGNARPLRVIAAVREVPSVPVRCIQVSSLNGLFLVTRSYIATHNSSLGRLGLLIHSTAGFIDPGWDGHVTLELSNVANLPITIYYGMKIGQLSFVQLTEPAASPYGSDALGSKYQGQRGPTPSRYWKNFEDGS
jgi:deoxycytidine triphosphate deaminase